jgi:HD-like signal output (HDOD) protein
LLHDIGYWILVQECPEELGRALELSRSGDLPLFECERMTTGATHAEVGAYLLGLWGLPYSIVEAVALHHTPGTITPHGYDLLSALSVSHALLESTGAHALVGGGKPNAGVDASYLAALDSPYDWDQAQRRVRASMSPAN